jgi:hypothetical protein
MEEMVGKLIYLPKRDIGACVEEKHDRQGNNTMARLLLGIGGMLLLYGLCRLVRTIENS